MNSRQQTTGALIALVASVVISHEPVGYTATWDPVNRQELALAAPVVDKDADAEVIVWDVRVTDDRVGGDIMTTYESYVRIKIFTDRGREKQSRVDIPHLDHVRVRDVEGRTVRKDGSTVELKKADIFERELVRASGLKIKSTSFVLPAVETGGLVEYRWREVQDDTPSHNLRLPFSREIPVQLVRYHVQPLSIPGWDYAMKAMPFNGEPSPLVREGPKMFMTSMSKVRAYPEEPRSPSEWETRPWMLIYYDKRVGPMSPSEFWTSFSKEMFNLLKKATAPSSQIRRAVAGLVPATATEEEKLTAAIRFSRSKIARIDLDTVSEAEKKGFKNNETPTQALEKGRGTGDDVVELFVAAAKALGLDARIAFLASRYDAIFEPGMMLPQLLVEHAVAVKMGGEWRFLDPANTYSPTAHLRWFHEGQQAVIPDDAKITVGKITAAAPDWSTRKRTASFTLSEDGTLEGDVRAEYTGHFDISRKEQADHLAPAERVKELSDAIVKRIKTAEVTAVEVTNVTDPDKPYTHSYHLRVPGYAQKTGSRIFFQPSVLEKGVEPEFTARQRTQPVFFNHAWRELDKITITLPPGYALEATEMPGDVRFARYGGFKLSLTGTPDGTRIELGRDFFFGGEQRVWFPQDIYTALKMFFDGVTKADGFTLTLRKAATLTRPVS